MVGFFLDLMLAVVAMLGLMIACTAAWAAMRGLQLGFAAGLEAVPNAAGRPGPMALLWTTLISTGGATLLVYWWRRRATAEEVLQSMAAARRVATWGWVAVAGVSTFLVSSAVTALAQRAGTQPQPSNLALIEAAFDANPTLLLMFGVLVAPMYEELLFRRVLFGRLWAAGRPWLGLVLSSAVFALMHELPGTGGNSWQATALLWCAYAAMGAVFAGLYWYTRTLWAPIAAHALNNAIALAVLQTATS